MVLIRGFGVNVWLEPDTRSERPLTLRTFYRAASCWNQAVLRDNGSHDMVRYWIHYQIGLYMDCDNRMSGPPARSCLTLSKLPRLSLEPCWTETVVMI